MISELETRLAAWIGTRISTSVEVAPGVAPAAGARVVVGVTEAEILERDIGGRRETIVPPDLFPRRTVRMRCTISLEAQTLTADRAGQMKVLDGVLYALDSAEMLNELAVAEPAGSDLGFLIQEFRSPVLAVPLDPTAQTGTPFVTLVATGLFWPVDTKGVKDSVINEITVRSGGFGINIFPPNPHLVANGPALDLTVSFVAVGLDLTTQPIGSLPPVVMTLAGTGNNPVGGTLGGTPGKTNAIRIPAMTKGSATIGYTPGAVAGVDELIVAFDNGHNDLGIEIGRVTLTTRST